MKTKLFYFFIVLCFILYCNNTKAQWQRSSSSAVTFLTYPTDKIGLGIGPSYVYQKLHLNESTTDANLGIRLTSKGQYSTTSYYNSWDIINDPIGYTSQLIFMFGNTTSGSSNPTMTPRMKLDNGGVLWISSIHDLDGGTYVLDIGSTSNLNVLNANRINVPKIYDKDNSAYYLDPESGSVLNTVDATQFRSRINPEYYLNPSTTGVALKVKGKIEAAEIEVKLMSTNDIKSDFIDTKKIKVDIDNVADYVFEPDYSLPSLFEVEKFVKENKHLPGIPAGKELEQNGMDIAEINNLLLQKVEELTLYMIELEKKYNELKSVVEK